ncbi:MAG TPA: branched-chain amino acid ABC transporter permease [Stellaceae bacterium]
MDFATLAQLTLSGLTTGCVYALVAIGFVLCANVSGIVNFAQGEYVMVGGIVTAGLVSMKFPLGVAIVIAVALGAVLGLVQERLTVAPIRRAPMFLQATVALGVAVLIRSVALVVWGKDPYGMPGFIGDDAFLFLGALLPLQALFVWGATALFLAVTFWLLKYTELGRAIRAVAINPRAARLMGIEIGRISMLVFAASGAAGALAGVAIAPITSASWDSGLEFGVKGFTGAIIGGFRSPFWATVAGLGIGMLESLSAGYVSSEAKDIVTYGVLLLYLMIRGGVFALGGRATGAADQH